MKLKTLNAIIIYILFITGFLSQAKSSFLLISDNSQPRNSHLEMYLLPNWLATPS